MTAPVLSKANDVIKITNPKFVFEHQGNEFVWVLQMLTGVKTLYVNGELYKRDFRAWCRSGRYDISIGDDKYQLAISQDSNETFDFKEINAPLVASFTLNDEAIANRRYSIKGNDVAKHLVYSLALGLAIGFTLSHYLQGRGELMLVNARKLKELRLGKNWTQTQLAEQSHLSLRTVQRVEKDGVASHETVAAYCAVFEIGNTELLLTAEEFENEASTTGLPNLVFVVVGFLLGSAMTAAFGYFF